MGNSNIANFLVSAGIYGQIAISAENIDELREIISGKQKYVFDAYCPHCEAEATFCYCDFEKYWESMERQPKIKIMGGNPVGFSQQIHDTYVESEDAKYKRFIKENNLCCLTAHCTRNTTHKLWIFIKMDEDKLIKIGQYPTTNLMQSPKLNRYKKLLGKWFIELKTAVTLHTHNVGVGSYVYLRRIFESIIFDKYIANKGQIASSEQEFLRLRMDEKIKVLEAYLPAFIVENKGIYSILSIGIHELREEDCNHYFDTIEQSIEMILDEIIEQKQREEKQKVLSMAVATIKGTIKGQDGNQH